MAFPSLPSLNSPDWFTWGAAVHAKASGDGHVLNVKDYGAVGNGVTDDSAAFAAVALAAKNGTRTVPYAFQSDKSGGVVIEIPPGDYLITNPGAFLGDEAPTVKGFGLIWRGAGQMISNIIFKPSTANALITNDYWLGLKFQDIGFLADTAGCTFMRSYTTHNAQRYVFMSCRFWGWKYVIDLQGDNNNSELSFYDCHSGFIEAAGAFLYVGTTSTSDQFLNYWFYACTHWTTSAPFIDMARGGHVHIYGLDISDWGASLSSAAYVFALRGFTHAYGVCQFEANGVRVEAKNVNARLLYSEWPQGNVAFRSCDWSSQAAFYTYGDIIYIDVENVNGAQYTFRDSQLAGGVRIKFAGNVWQHSHHIRFEDCTWLQKNSPSDVVSWDTSAASGSTNLTPWVDFRHCRSEAGNPFTGTVLAQAIWDARIGFKGELVQTLTPRTIAVRGSAGTAADPGPYSVFNLPVGAIVTGLRVLSPAGTSPEATGGSFILRTTEATPTVIATAVVSGAMSAGYDVTATPTTPFVCSTTARASLQVATSAVTNENPGGLVLVTGYW